MRLTDQERQRIYEEEKTRREVRPQSPTDQLSGCVLGCLQAIGLLLLLAVIGFVVLCVWGAIHPDYR